MQPGRGLQGTVAAGGMGEPTRASAEGTRASGGWGWLLHPLPIPGNVSMCRCSAGFLLAPLFPHFPFGFMKSERSWGWTPRQHTTGFVETRRKHVNSPRTGRLRTEGHLSTTFQSLGHRVPEEAPTWVAAHLKPMGPGVHGPTSTCV